MKRLYIALMILFSMIIISQLTISDEVKMIEVDEGELVNLRVIAVDEDDDTLTYQYSEPLDENGEWQTEYGDYGEYMIAIVVSDGITNTTEEIMLIVKKVNWPPVLEEMNDMVITETEKVIIEPEAFDEEGDEITYTFSEPIGNDGEWQTGYDDAGKYDITVTASDGEHSVSESFVLIVEDLNRDPEIRSFYPDEDFIDIEENEDVEFSVTAVDLDGDKVEYSWQLDGNEVSTSSSYIYNADYESAGEHKIRVDVSDEETVLRREWRIVVEDVNRAPVLEPILDIVVNESDKVVINFTAKDPDGDDVFYTIEEPVGNDKEWQTGFEDAGEYKIEVKISDGDLEDMQTVKVTVLDVDRAPMFKKIDDITITEEEKVIINLKAEDPDGDDVSFSVVEMPNGSILDEDVFEFIPTYSTVQKPGNWFNRMLNTLHLDGLYYKDYKKFKIRFVAAGKYESTEQEVVIKVTNVNRAPTMNAIDDITIDEDSVVKIKPSAFDPDNDRLSFTISEPIGNDGKWGTNFNHSGVYTVTVNVTDGEFEDSTDFDVVVNNVNRNPVFKDIKKVKIGENSTVSIKPVIFDPDQDTIELYVENMPNGSSFVDGMFEWTPDYDTTIRGVDKDFIITFVATDSLNATAVQDALITVENVNRKPVVLTATPDKVISAYLNEPVYFAAEPYDDDNDTLVYTWKFSTFNGINDINPELTRTFTKEGDKTIKLLVSDGESSITKRWVVNVVGERPSSEPKQPSKKIRYTIDNKYVKDAETSFVIDDETEDDVVIVKTGDCPPSDCPPADDGKVTFVVE